MGGPSNRGFHSWIVTIAISKQQAGFRVLPPTRGRDGVYPPPRDDNAIYLDPQDQRESDLTLDMIRRFIYEGLNVYDQEDLASMGIADYFHPNVQWYGPGGIGACFGLKEFEDMHQSHWLHAFPDRSVQPLDWVFVDMLHLFCQFGVDLLARVSPYGGVSTII